MSIEKIMVKAAGALLVGLHVEMCKECRKKYQEIMKHMEVCYEHAKKESDTPFGLRKG